MKTAQTKQQNTTVSVTSKDRDRINELADGLNLSQREMVTRLLESYQGVILKDKAPSDSDPPNDTMAAIMDALDKVVKRDDRVIAFIKEQEKVLLNPTLLTVQRTDTQLQKLIEILSNLE